MSELTQKELDERVAILRRFRGLLEQQRKKFRDYLTILEKQQGSIEKEDADAILVHAELEQQVVASIANLQKVIVPMNQLYNISVKGSDNAAEKSVSELQSELTSLQDKVLEQNQRNRTLLREHLEVIKKQLSDFKNPYKNNRSVYAVKQAQGSLVTVEA